MTTPAPDAALSAPASETDRRFMQAAIALGRRNNGRAWPNPSVGAILVREEGGVPVVIGRGCTAEGGRPHAEVIALAEAGEAARGATLYVTLEPCAHHGRTPPCSDALVRAGIARAVVAITDPDPRVAGRGLQRLAGAGVRLTTGVLAEEAARLHAGHIRRIRSGRPHVSLKLAMSADGAIGRLGAGQVAISGPEARAYAHALRAESDAILVGIGTVLADDPELTCRLPGLQTRSPVRVVLDAQARTPVEARLVSGARQVPTWIFVAPDAPADRLAALAQRGVHLLVAERGADDRLDLEDVLFQLAREGITRLMVEGGASVARTLIEAGLVDEAHLVESDVTIGADGVPGLAGLPLDALIAAPQLTVLSRRRLGADRLTHLFVKEIA